MDDRLFQKGNFLNFEGFSFCVLNQKHGAIDWGHFPQVDMILISETPISDTILMHKHLPTTLIVENRKFNKAFEVNQKQKEVIGETNLMNTSIGGAVQILFSSDENTNRNKLSWKYFNR